MREPLDYKFLEGQNFKRMVAKLGDEVKVLTGILFVVYCNTQEVGHAIRFVG